MYGSSATNRKTRSGTQSRAWAIPHPRKIATCLATVAIVVAQSTTRGMPQAGQRGTAATPPAAQATPANPSGPSQPGSQPAQTPAPSAAAGAFKIADQGTLRVSPGVTSGSFFVSSGAIKGGSDVKPEALVDAARHLTLKDGGPLAQNVSAITMTFTPAYVTGTPATGILWNVPFNASVLPYPTSHMRRVLISFPGHPDLDTWADYTLTNVPPSSATFEIVDSGQPWLVSWDEGPGPPTYSVLAKTEDQPIANLRLVQATLRDSAGTRQIDGTRVTLRDVASEGKPINLGPREVRPLMIQMSGPGPSGSFTGTLRFAADHLTLTRDVQLQVKATSRSAKVWGLIWVFAGLLVSWFLTAGLKPRLARLQALRPVAAMRAAIELFEREVDAVTKKSPQPPPPILSSLGSEAEELRQGLDTTVLEELGMLPSPALTDEQSVASAASLQKRLDETSGRLAVLMIVLREGVRPLLRDLETGADPNRVATALSDIERALPSLRTAEEARAKITAARQAAFRIAGDVAPRGAVADNVQTIDFRIEQTNNVVWFIWACVSLVVAAATIFPDPDFGGASDFALSFLWGFGLTSFGASLPSLTTGAIGTHVGLSLPKTGG